MSGIELWEATLSGLDNDGFYGIQRSGQAAAGGAQAGLTPDRLYHPYAFVSRPRDPDASGACQLFYHRAGTGEGYSWLANDPRDKLIIPPLKKGGSAWYCWTGAFQSFDGDDGTLTVYIPYAEGTKAHLLTVGKDGNGTPIIELASGEGPSFTILDKVATLKNASGSAYVFVDDDGVNVVGPLKAAGGADIGGPTSEALTKQAKLLTLLQALAAYVASMTPTGATAGAAANFVTALGAFTSTGGTLTTKGA